MNKQAYIIEDAAPLLSLAPKTLYQLIRAGRVRAVKVGRRWMIAPEEIERVAREGTQTAPAKGKLP